MTETDVAFYRRRAAEEDAKAASPMNLQVRHVHRQLADLYRARIAHLEAAELPQSSSFRSLGQRR